MVCLALGFRILTNASIKGVVNAPILLIQSPIDGRVTTVGLKAGNTVDEGELLFGIENQRLDTANLERVRSEIKQSEAATDALKTLIKEYTLKRGALDGRLKDYLEATKNNITKRLKDATQEQVKAEEAEAQAMRDLPRQRDVAKREPMRECDGRKLGMKGIRGKPPSTGTPRNLTQMAEEFR